MADKFKMQYAAPTQEERRIIEKIRRDYQQPNESTENMKRIKALDFQIRILPKLLYTFTGILGCLIFGVGLTFLLEWNQPYTGVAFIIASIMITPLLCLFIKKITKGLESTRKKELLELASALLEKNVEN